jgi:hypothetical protein
MYFDHFEDQLKLRNAALHGRDDAEHSLFHHARLCAKATRLYAQAGTRIVTRPPHPITTTHHSLDLPTTGV